MKNSRLMAFPLLLTLFSGAAHAVPIDWRGAFGVDTTLLTTFRKIESTADNSNVDLGTQEVPNARGSQAKASFQSYLFRLNPIMVVNDSATIKAEITTGYGRGGYFGDSSTESKQGNLGNALYFYNTNNGASNLILSKLYAELYSDAATYVVGRQSTNFGLGLVYSSGDNLWDRQSYIRDGLTMKVKIGNFHAAPYYAVLNRGTTLTRATNASEYGATLTYDNPERDLTLGIIYAKREHDWANDTIKTSVTATNTNADYAYVWGKTEIKIVDLYLKKTFSRFTIGAEFPMFNGEMGNLNNDGTQVKYNAKALVGQGNYKFNDNWKAGLDAGTISGDSGGKNGFKAMYLNPNFQIANILFRYNLFAISNPSKYNVWDSYITNTKFAKAQLNYVNDKWEWNWALIHAVANEAAKGGNSDAFNHTTNHRFVSKVAQSDKMGTEFDCNLTFHWNNDVEVGGNFGYLFTGDYWAYTNNSATKNSAKDTWLVQARTGISF